MRAGKFILDSKQKVIHAEHERERESTKSKRTYVVFAMCSNINSMNT